MEKRNSYKSFLGHLSGQKFCFSALLCAILIVSLYSIGLISYDRVAGYSVSFIGHMGLVGLCISAAVCIFILYYLITFLYHHMDNLAPSSSHKTLSFKQIFLFLLLFWLPVYLIRFPGNFDPDTFDQIQIGYGLFPASDHHPWLDTLLFTGIWKLGDLLHSHTFILFLYTTLQMLATAALFSCTLCWMSRRQIPSYVCTISLWFLAFFPFVPMLTQTMAKDMVHGLFFLPFYILFIDIINTRGTALSSRLFCTCFLLASLLMILTKKTGIYLFIPSLFFSAFCIKTKRPLLVLLSAGVILGWFGWQSCLLPLLHIEKGEQREIMPIPSQQISYLVRNRSDELTDEDWQVLEGVYNSPQTIADRYFPLRADAAKMHWKENASGKELFSFFQWYIKAWIRWPFSMLESWCANHFPLLCIDTKNTADDESYLFFRNNIPQVGSYAVNVVDPSLFEDIYRSSWRADLITAIDAVYLHFASCFPILFTKPLYAVWLPLFVLMYALHRRSFRLFVMLLPLLLNTATLTITSIVVPRYMLISIYCLPVLLSLPFMISSGSEKNNRAAT